MQLRIRTFRVPEDPDASRSCLESTGCRLPLFADRCRSPAAEAVAALMGARRVAEAGGLKAWLQVDP